MIMTVMGFPIEIISSSEIPSDSAGFCEPDQAKIYVRSGLPRAERIAVMYHEIGHYIWYKMVTEEKVDEETFCKMCEMFSTWKSTSEDNLKNIVEFTKVGT